MEGSQGNNNEESKDEDKESEESKKGLNSVIIDKLKNSMEEGGQEESRLVRIHKSDSPNTSTIEYIQQILEEAGESPSIDNKVNIQETYPNIVSTSEERKTVFMSPLPEMSEEIKQKFTGKYGKRSMGKVGSGLLPLDIEKVVNLGADKEIVVPTTPCKLDSAQVSRGFVGRFRKKKLLMKTSKILRIYNLERSTNSTVGCIVRRLLSGIHFINEDFLEQNKELYVCFNNEQACEEASRSLHKSEVNGNTILCNYIYTDTRGIEKGFDNLMTKMKGSILSSIHETYGCDDEDSSNSDGGSSGKEDAQKSLKWKADAIDKEYEELTNKMDQLSSPISSTPYIQSHTPTIMGSPIPTNYPSISNTTYHHNRVHSLSALSQPAQHMHTHSYPTLPYYYSQQQYNTPVEYSQQTLIGGNPNIHVNQNIPPIQQRGIMPGMAKTGNYQNMNNYSEDPPPSNRTFPINPYLHKERGEGKAEEEMVSYSLRNTPQYGITHMTPRHTNSDQSIGEYEISEELPVCHPQQLIYSHQNKLWQANALTPTQTPHHISHHSHSHSLHLNSPGSTRIGTETSSESSFDTEAFNSNHSYSSSTGHDVQDLFNITQKLNQGGANMARRINQSPEKIWWQNQTLPLGRGERVLHYPHRSMELSGNINNINNINNNINTNNLYPPGMFQGSPSSIYPSYYMQPERGGSGRILSPAIHRGQFRFNPPIGVTNGLRKTGIEIQVNRAKYQINLQNILFNKDRRTTLMIRNIPNKYSQKMLLTLINEKFSFQYDFFYLPIDFKNKCNVGYAFINFVLPLNVIPFYEEVNGQKWAKFNSEKICQLTYGRIQGKQALIDHFVNSCVMKQTEKKVKPLILDVREPDEMEISCFQQELMQKYTPKILCLQEESLRLFGKNSLQKSQIFNFHSVFPQTYDFHCL